MSVQDDTKHIPSGESQMDLPASPGRRKLLGSGVKAMPVILTLQSGAALARSSNLISGSSPETTDALNRTLCLDTNSVKATSRANVYDAGQPPEATCNIISDRDWYVKTDRGLRSVSKPEMCIEGGPYIYKPEGGGGFQTAELPANGMVVSAGAMKSIAGYVKENLI